MRKWNTKTSDMLAYNIHWIDISKRLNIADQTLLLWRQGNDVIRHEAIGKVVSQLIDEKKAVTK